MYVRFVITDNHPGSGKRQGLFHAIRDLSDDGMLHGHEQELYDNICLWFNKNLEKPSSFSRSGRPKALSWFKDDALEHIQWMREISNILKSHGIHVEMIRTNRPGYIVYEDDHQVTAEPFRDTQT